jgi:predicted Zn-dependent peptidase
LCGVSHFLEHLLFKGTETRSAIDISQAIDRVGGDINAYTAKEYTAYYCRLPARHAATGIELLGDVLTAPALRDADVDSERRVILEELAMDDDSPEDVAHRVFHGAVFGEHPLGRDTAGDRESVTGLSTDVVRRYYDHQYRTENTVVAVAGGVDVDEVVDHVTKAFDGMRCGSAVKNRTTPSDDAMTPGATVSIDDDTEQVHLVVGGRSPGRLDADREALDVANHVLGGGLSSRLFDEIRERRGLAYSVFSSSAAYADTGAWSIYAGTTPDNAAEVRHVVGAEIARLVAFGITADELDIAKGYLAGAYEMGLEDSGARMARLAGQLTLLGGLRSVEEQLERWSNVTIDDVHRVATRVYGAADPVTVAIGPT